MGQTRSGDERAQLPFGQEVGVTGQFHHCEAAARTKHACDRRDACTRVRHLPEHGYQKHDVEGSVEKRQRGGAGLREPCVPDAGPRETTARFVEHLALDVEQLQPPARQGAGHINAEEAGAGSNLEDAPGRRQLQLLEELGGRQDEAAHRRQQQEREFVRVRTAAAEASPDVPPVCQAHRCRVRVRSHAIACSLP